MAAARCWELIMDVDVEMVLLHGILLHADVALEIMWENEVEGGCLTMGMEDVDCIIIVLKWDKSEEDVVGRRGNVGVLFAEKCSNVAAETLKLRDNNESENGVQRRNEDDDVVIKSETMNTQMTKRVRHQWNRCSRQGK